MAENRGGLIDLASPKIEKMVLNRTFMCEIEAHNLGNPEFVHRILNEMAFFALPIKEGPKCAPVD